MRTGDPIDASAPLIAFLTARWGLISASRSGRLRYAPVDHGPWPLHSAELLHLDDMTRSFSYRITKCEIPWMNYVSGPRLWPVTADNTTFGVWTGDWVASPQDDVVLIPRTEQNVYQRAFAELERNYFGKKRKT